MGCVEESHHGRVFQATLDGDRIEPLPDSIDSSYHLHLILPTNLFFQDRRSGKQPMSCLSEGF